MLCPFSSFFLNSEKCCFTFENIVEFKARWSIFNIYEWRSSNHLFKYFLESTIVGGICLMDFFEVLVIFFVLELELDIFL